MQGFSKEASTYPKETVSAFDREIRKINRGRRWVKYKPNIITPIYSLYNPYIIPI